MKRSPFIRALLMGSVCAFGLASTALARSFDIPGGDLERALEAFTAQSGVNLIVADDQVRGIHTRGVSGDYGDSEALAHILSGTGFVVHRHLGGAIGIVPAEKSEKKSEAVGPEQFRLASAAPAAAAASVETVIVTSSKIKGDIQTVPIAITALSQEQLTARQIAGGPDLVKEVPNLTFSKTNFTGYNIQIRGIGTQAISVTTDPAVAVALNDIPFIRNHFFEQEFYDVNQVEVLRGPQGTLYGRNATAGVVNVISAKPTDQFEAMLSADWGNYANRRYEAMVNLPIVDDWLYIRLAGEWTKRDGYTKNELTGAQVDGRDLWSTRLSVRWRPLSDVQADLVWEHFQESDNRMRTAKQLCMTDTGPGTVLGVVVPSSGTSTSGIDEAFSMTSGHFSQGCLPTSMYSKRAFEVPYGYSLPYVVAGYTSGFMRASIDPYASTTQSTNLRNIETAINPRYRAKNDTLELNVDYAVTPTLTFTSQSGYNQDFLWSTEDFNRFDTSPGVFETSDAFFPTARQATLVQADGNYLCYVTHNVVPNAADCAGQGAAIPTATFCDPQLGCSNRLVAQDLSDERAWQAAQEFRLASNFTGPLNFSVGGNYMHYETVEDYYLFANAITLFAATSASGDLPAWDPGVSDNHECLSNGYTGISVNFGHGRQYHDPHYGAGQPTSVCYYIDPNPLNHLNNAGHNYFLSRNPYVLTSYAGFGEAYYNLMHDVKLTGGVRWTSDHKHFIDIPSEVLAEGYGYGTLGTVNQQWNQLTGRFAADWTPKLAFTDQSLFYASFAHGYKAGGANPPGAVVASYGTGLNGVPIHPLTFKPEFIDAYELGTKNTLWDGGLTMNGDVFFYNYKNYQISEIVDRTSINLNFDATVKGAEIEASYEPVPGLKFNFAGGYEATRIGNNQSAIDLMDRTDKAHHPDWLIMKPWVQYPSNCILPSYVVAALIVRYLNDGEGNSGDSACEYAYYNEWDPVVLGAYSGVWTGANDPSRNLVNGQPYYTVIDPFSGNTLHGYPVVISRAGYPTFNYMGFDPTTAPNNGEGFAKELGGNQLPNAPHFTVSLSAEYTVPLSEDWAGTLHTDFYWQSQSFARVFNDRPYDKIRGYSNVNLALVLTGASGWQVMGYVKNVFDTTAITGTFLNSDDTGLTTNVFLTDPRLFGVRVTKNW